MASNLIGTWIDVTNVSGAKTESQEVEQEKVPNVEEGVHSLLTLFDLGQDTIAVDALSRMFTWRPDIFNNILFGGMLY
jgi:hypothetical protein